MPNHCYNQITIQSTKEDIEKIVEHLRGKDSMFDFNSLVPMPEEIQDTHLLHKGGERYHYSQKKWLTTLSKEQKADNPERFQFPSITWVEENLIDPFTIRRLTQQHGTAYWYDWSIQHWGTKWNAYDVEYCISPVKTLSLLHTKITEPCKVVYTLLTAWAEPRPILKALRDYLQPPDFSEHLELEWRFRDEMEDYNGVFTKTDEV